jgi:glycosyltransferase involved in cell wall biosynthesis
MRLPFEVHRAEIVHLADVYAFTTIPTMLACRFIGRPLVWSPRGALRRWQGGRAPVLKRVWELACRIAAPRNTVLQLMSEAERAESLRCFPNFSATIIPQAVRIPSSVNHAAANGTLRLGYIGRLHPGKGLDHLLEACRILKDRKLAFSLAIAGAGRVRYTRSLKDKIAALGLDGAVQMLGEVHGGAKRGFFEALDLLVVPAVSSGFAAAVAEGLAAAVPVIASRGTPWERLEDKGCGLWVDIDPESLADAIQRMRAMPLATMGQRGREWMSEEFSWAGTAREVCNTYSIMLHGSPILGDAEANGSSLASIQQSASRN